MRHKNGQHIWMLVRAVVVRDEDDKAIRLAGSMIEITAMKRAESRLRRRALTDKLTGLPNRDLFSARTEKAIALDCSPQRFTVRAASISIRAAPDKVAVTEAMRTRGYAYPAFSRWMAMANHYNDRLHGRPTSVSPRLESGTRQRRGLRHRAPSRPRLRTVSTVNP